MGIILPLILISICCLVIWRAGDGFMTASEYVGRNLSDGVRGATINAVASSMPEVFTSLFFLFIMKDAEGFSGGIGTTAGSAIFNSMVIPAVAVLAVIGIGLTKRVRVSKKVMLRDGLSLLIAELIFIVLISGSLLDWYHGLLLMLVYVVYIIYMFWSMDKKQREEMLEESHVSEEDFEDEERKQKPFLLALVTLDLERVFIGKKKINDRIAWSLLIFSTLCIAAVCYLLVLACEWIGHETYEVPFLGELHGLGIPVMFVALILASAASSFPDTIISIKDAQRGQYDDAISNALGSNIFDICFALGFPLFIFTLMYGPIPMSQEMVDLSSELRFLLWLLTALVLIIFITGGYIGRLKAGVLLVLYFLFVAYVVARGSGNEYAQAIADWLVSVVRWFSIS
ncbi:sodium:calcium antiporter [Marinoscillum sp.]|uniref:sodium:calcium antiporter n=1 Tax=Marinoscillum sp. TaxID=2024838 RepID=UPI003BABE9F5